ncbi:nucleotidyltransferase family protein [Roseobacter sinensis]|uniref:Nucleotidyltransferase family protein n=1 Tax=Roseobacter sinensis TaxID=2931391 RepID=A0ABT3BA23_9RHOB|nr:nucleotidyltransferase family protein [Roseobacter sp. WL0113]MCV3269993.1 nucleotidyltransferase family protein [Roseobacter sp. WL0113]
MRDLPGSVMLFAAGFGARMRPLTDDRPKPLVDVAGRPLIDHALDQITGIPPERIVANLHYRPDQLARHLAERGVQTVLEHPEILDTGGGLRNALPQLGAGPVFTLNTDTIWKGPSPLDVLRAAWQPDIMDALLICVPLAQTHAYAGQGDFVLDAENRLGRGAGHVYGGAQIIRTDRLAEIPEAAFSLNRIWDLMHAEGRLFGVRYPGRWCDVGHPAGIAAAEALLADPHV